MHPSQLCEVLLREHPNLEDVPPANLHRYASLILQLAANGTRRHHLAGTGGVPLNARYFHCRELERMFGIGGFHKINAIANCVEQTENWSHSSGTTRAYWLSAIGHAAIERARLNAMQGEENELLTDRGFRVRSRENGIFTARDSAGNNAVIDARIPWAVPVNMRAIEAALSQGIESCFPGIDSGRARQTDASLRAIHACALNGNIGYGLIPQEYREYPSGRIYSIGSLSLQNVTREAKTVALAGAHEFDFENCHWQLLANVAEGLGIEAAEIVAYCRARHAYRAAIAEDVGITPEQAKKCLLMLIYGAQKNVWPDSSIPREIGPEKAAVLYASPPFDALSFELQTILDAWREAAPRHPSGKIINARGKALRGNERQEAAHLLQGLESVLLQTVLDEWGELALLLQHDGFAFSQYIHPAEIEAEISYQLGIDIAVSYQLLRVPGLRVNA